VLALQVSDKPRTEVVVADPALYDKPLGAEFNKHYEASSGRCGLIQDPDQDIAACSAVINAPSASFAEKK
jgi:hypothetical protein